MLETLLLATALSINPDMGNTHEYPRQYAVREERAEERVKKNRHERRKEQKLRRKR